MATIITVHGTNAGRPEDVGDQWWQKESPYQTELAKRIEPADGTPLSFFPFHWTGANSELARREAGRDLFNLMVEMEAGDGAYHVMGHSHGGSVAMEALRRSGTLAATAAQFYPLQKLGSWMTIGTPFLEFRKKRFVFSRLNTPGQIAFLIASILIALVGAQIYALQTVFSPEQIIASYESGDAAYAGEAAEKARQAYEAASARMREPERGLMEQFMTFMGTSSFAVIAGLLALAGLMLYPIYRSQQSVNLRYARRTARWLRSRYEKIWTALYDEDDEAINGIAASLTLNGQLAPPFFLVGAVKLILYLAVGYAAIFLSLSLIRPEIVEGILERSALGQDNFVIGYTRTLIDIVTPGGEPVTAPAVFGVVLIGILMFAAPLTAVFFIFQWVGRLISPPIARRFDGFFWQQVRNKAFGNDTVGELSEAIRPGPREFKTDWKPLPKTVNQDLQDYTSELAAETVRKARDVLGMARTHQDTNVVQAISDQLSWGELIHTAYFDVPSFIDLSAYALIDTGHFRPTPEFRGTEAFEAAKRAYGQIKP